MRKPRAVASTSPPPSRVASEPHRALLIAAFAGWVVIAALLVVSEVQDADLGFHVATGRMLQSDFRAVGATSMGQDPSVLRTAYSYWLYQILVANLFDHGGPPAVVFLRALLLLGSLIAAGLLARRMGASPAAVLLGAAFALFLSEERIFLDRPEHLSYALWVAALWILLRHRSDRGTWLLVPIQIIWANSHIWFGLLPALVVLFAAGDRIEHRPGLRRALLLLAALLAASIATPQGPAVWASQLTVLRFLGERGYLPFQIQEMASPYAGFRPIPAIWGFRIGMPLALLIAFIARKRLGAGALLVLVFSALLGAQARRAMPLFGLTSAVFLPLALDSAAERLAPRRAPALRGALASALLALAVLGIWQVATGRFFIRQEQDVRFGFQLHPRWPSLQAARFLREHDVQGPIFHNGVSAGAILLMNATRLTPFIDARWAGTPETMAAYQRIRTASDETIGPIWEEIASARGFEAALVDFYETGALLRLLHRHPGWALVHRDETAVVFCRRHGKNEALVARLEAEIQAARARPDPARARTLARAAVRFLRAGPPPLLARLELPYGALFRANYALQIGDVDEAQTAYLELLEQDRGALRFYPRRAGLAKNLLWCLRESGETAAIAELAARAAEPSSR